MCVCVCVRERERERERECVCVYVSECVGVRERKFLPFSIDALLLWHSKLLLRKCKVLKDINDQKINPIN